MSVYYQRWIYCHDHPPILYCPGVYYVGFSGRSDFAGSHPGAADLDSGSRGSAGVLKLRSHLWSRHWPIRHCTCQLNRTSSVLLVSSPYTLTPYIAESQDLRDGKIGQCLSHVVFDPDFLKHVIFMNYNANWDLLIFSRVTSKRGAAQIPWVHALVKRDGQVRVIHSFSGPDGLFLAPLGKSSTDASKSKFRDFVSNYDWLDPLTIRTSEEDAGWTYIQ